MNPGHHTLARTVRRVSGAVAAAALTASAIPALAAVEADDLPDGTWITLAGMVTEVDEGNFEMDHAGQTITVETDDFAGFGEGWVLNPGDRVTVYGMVDDELFESADIEASGVYVQDLGTMFYESAMLEREMGAYLDPSPVTLGEVVLVGTVVDVMPNDDTFTLDRGAGEVMVDVGTMPHDPLDDAGFQRIETGDRVSVAGSFDDAMFADGYVYADSIVSLSD